MALSLKLAVVSATVVSAAVMLSPFITNFTISDLPTIYTSLISWLKPPYLYLVINCIIITIVASSRLHSKIDSSESDHSLSTFPTPTVLPTDPVNVDDVVNVPVELQPVHEPQLVNVVVGGYDEYDSDQSKFFEAPEPEIETPVFCDKFPDEDMMIAKKAYEEIKKNRVDKSVISVSAWTPSIGLSFPMEKPPVSARFSHRKPVKPTAEGGRTLGIAKPKRQDTLESTWKAITEGRSVPFTRHLRKSDTWETHGGRENRNTDELSTDDISEKMKKSETFDVNRGGGSCRKPPPPPSKLNRSGGSGRLRKEPSLGQEELNRRVEAFIKKFNEDMRLQRQESLNQYMEMINRGAH